MATVLVTGSTGSIGSRLLPILQSEYTVIGMARSAARDHGKGIHIRGAFHSFEDLRKLDAYRIDAVVHLAAVLRGSSEEDGIEVNVAGTRRLVRYLLDRGCRRFVLASSVAAAGVLSAAFVPRQLPVPATHPSFAADAYGLSKWFMEEMSRYFARREPGAEFINLRFGLVKDDKNFEPRLVATANLAFPFLQLGIVLRSDVLEAINKALAAPYQAGVRTFNIVAPDVCSAEPVAIALRGVLKERAQALDLSYYEQPGHEYAPVYEVDTTQQELGHASTRSVRPHA
jgi:nucleoside-diphosphate-sugar epimerase